MTVAEAVDKVLVHEQGYSNHPKDLGGETMCGIARRYWPGWPGWPLVDEAKAQGELPTITPALLNHVVDFYQQHFWDKVRAGEMPSSVGYEVFEQAVNLGVGRASMHLQEAVNLLNTGGWPEIKVDGKIGPFTLLALKRCDRQYRLSLLKLLNSLQAEWYISLTRRTPSQKVFLRGWLSRT